MPGKVTRCEPSSFSGRVPLSVRAAEFADRGRTAQQRGDADGALAHYDDALSLLEDEGDDTLAADLLRWKGAVFRERGETAAAHRFFSRSLAMAQRLEYMNGQAHALNCLGTIAQRRGDAKDASALYTSAAHYAQLFDDRHLLGRIEMNQGVIAASFGDWDSAIVWLRLSLKTFEGIADMEGASYALNNLGMQYAQRGRHGQAIESFERALEIAYEREDIIVEATVELNLADVRIKQDELIDAMRSVARALKIAEVRNDRLRIAEALQIRSRVERLRGRTDDAMESLRQARYHAREAEDALMGLELLRELGETWLAQGDMTRGRASLQESLNGFVRMGASHQAKCVAERLAAVGGE